MTISMHDALELQRQAQVEKIGRPCPVCGQYPFFLDYGTALLSGHVYSQAGRSEVRLTGLCEFCWDQMEPKEEREKRTGGVVDPDVSHELPLDGQVLQTVTNLNDYEVVSGRYDTDDPEIAQVITSRVAKPGHRHKVVLDIDVPAKLIPSSTPGHFHLYIDHEMEWAAYEKLLNALSDAGILEIGYVRASRERKLTAVRLPWVKKPSPSAEELVDQAMAEHFAETPVANGGDQPHPF